MLFKLSIVLCMVHGYTRSEKEKLSEYKFHICFAISVIMLWLYDDIVWQNSLIPCVCMAAVLYGMETNMWRISWNEMNKTG